MKPHWAFKDCYHIGRILKKPNPTPDSTATGLQPNGSWRKDEMGCYAAKILYNL
jgi:hypothetical protein